MEITKGRRAGAYITALCMILLSGSAWVVIFPNMRVPLLVLSVLGLLVMSGVDILRRQLVTAVSVTVILTIALIFFWKSALVSYCYQGAVILVGFCFVFNNRRAAFLEILFRCYMSLLVLGMLAYVVNIFLGFSVGELTSPRGVKYLNNIFSLQLTHDIYRFNAIFWEPGLMCSNNAIIISLAWLGKITLARRDLVVLSLAFIMSQSFAGVVFLVLFWMVHLELTKRGAALIIGGGALLFFKNEIGAWLVQNNTLVDFGEKLRGESASALTRWNCLLKDIEIYASSPIWGVGMSEYYSIFNEVVRDNRELNAQTSTFTQHLAVFGCIAWVEIGAIIRALPASHRHFSLAKRLTVFGWLVFIGCKEPNTFNVLFACLILSWILQSHFLTSPSSKVF